MYLSIHKDKSTASIAAANLGAEKLRQSLAKKDCACLVIATGVSQFEILEYLAQAPGIDWSKVTVFHLDEYVGLSDEHPASFRRYVKDRFIARLPQNVGAAHLINGNESDSEVFCQELGKIIEKHPVDVTFLGFGNNGHLAFNDPPADFVTEKPYLVVELDEICRNQQYTQGWFKELKDVPKQAISMSIKQILKSKTLITMVSGSHKAEIVKAALEGPLTPDCPASILRQHADCSIFLDEPAAVELSEGYVCSIK